MSARGEHAADLPPSASDRCDVVRALALVGVAADAAQPPPLGGRGPLGLDRLWSVVPEPDEWPGASYEEMAVAMVPLLFAVSVVSAVSFHRERLEVAAEAPVREMQRSVGRFVATLPLLLVAVAYAALLGVAPARHRWPVARDGAGAHDGGALHDRRARPARRPHGARRGDRGGPGASPPARCRRSRCSS